MPVLILARRMLPVYSLSIAVLKIGQLEAMVAGLVAQRIVKRRVDMVDVGGDEVCQVGVLRAAPHRLNWIQLGTLDWQVLDFDSLPHQLRSPFLYRAMHAPAVPYTDLRSTDFPTEPTQEGDYGVGPDVLALHVEATRCTRAGRRQHDRSFLRPQRFSLRPWTRLKGAGLLIPKFGNRRTWFAARTVRPSNTPKSCFSRRQTGVRRA